MSDRIRPRCKPCKGTGHDLVPDPDSGFLCSGLHADCPSGCCLACAGTGLTAGATGNFPDGRVSSRDEGEIAIRFAADVQRGLVRIDFGKPVAWLALKPDEAEALGRALLGKASDVRGPAASPGGPRA